MDHDIRAEIPTEHDTLANHQVLSDKKGISNISLKEFVLLSSDETGTNQSRDSLFYILYNCLSTLPMDCDCKLVYFHFWLVFNFFQ